MRPAAAEIGTEVIKLEPPAGSASRRIGPFAGSVNDGEHSLHFWFSNANKRSLQLDLTRAGGVGAARSIVHGGISGFDRPIVGRRNFAADIVELDPRLVSPPSPHLF